MALLQQIITPSNHEANYWRIFSITNTDIKNGSKERGESLITLELWKDKATRDAVVAGAAFQPTHYERITTPVQTSISEAYAHLKTLERFSAAADC